MCQKEGLQYTKVLERLAHFYVITDGKVLKEATGSTSEVPEDAVTTGDLAEMQKKIEAMQLQLQEHEGLIQNMIDDKNRETWINQRWYQVAGHLQIDEGA